jgi:uncharacterized protein
LAALRLARRRGAPPLAGPGVKQKEDCEELTNENITSGGDTVEGIPVSWAVPRTGATGTALWLTHLGGSAEQAVPMLTRLAAERGLLAVSFDPPGHGRRGDGSSPGRLTGDVLACFRQRMWPLLGHTVLECLRVLDWAGNRFGVPGPLVAGGVSLGGDAAVALAGIDRRIRRVGAIVATPDWTRPAMRTLGEHPEVIGQGHADGYAPMVLRGLQSYDPPRGLRARRGSQVPLRR